MNEADIMKSSPMCTQNDVTKARKDESEKKV